MMAELLLAASPLPGHQLPTIKEVYQHSLHLTEVKTSSGEWLQRTTRSEKARCLAGEVAAVWEGAFLPHRLVGRQGEKLVLGLFDRVRSHQRREEKKNWRVGGRKKSPWQNWRNFLMCAPVIMK